MPLINVKLIENVFSSDQKAEIIEKLTDTMESISPGHRDLTFVVIDETKESDWGIGGKPITAAMVEEHSKKALGG